MARNVQVNGLKALQRALKELPKATQGAVLRRVLAKAAQAMADDAAANAPRDTNVLAQSIDTGTRLTKRQRRLAGKSAKMQADGSFRSAKSTGAEIYIGPASTGRQKAPDPSGLMQEFGNRNHSAQPWLRPAWDAHKQGALETISSELGTEIDKAAKRLAAKDARAARRAASGT